MPCYKESVLSFCLSKDGRDDSPIVVDPLSPKGYYQYDLVGKPLDPKEILEASGQPGWILDILAFVKLHSIAIGLLLPAIVPILHYAFKLAVKARDAFLLICDFNRILLSPSWRRLFGAQVRESLHPTYTMYVYCSDLIGIVSPEMTEFFHPDNQAQFLRLLPLLNPLRFAVRGKEISFKQQDEFHDNKGDMQEALGEKEVKDKFDEGNQEIAEKQPAP